LILLALPRGDKKQKYNNDLGKGEGKNTPIEFYSSQGVCPEPDWPPDPEIENAAPTVIGSGVKEKDPLKVLEEDYAEAASDAIDISEALSFNYCYELCDELASYALSAREAARRGSLGLVEGHFEQVVLVGKEIRQIIVSLRSRVPL
jgi:hypothetical protein